MLVLFLPFPFLYCAGHTFQLSVSWWNVCSSRKNYIAKFATNVNCIIIFILLTYQLYWCIVQVEQSWSFLPGTSMDTNFCIKQTQLFTIIMRQTMNQFPFPELKTASFQLRGRHLFPLKLNAKQLGSYYHFVFMMRRDRSASHLKWNLKLKLFSGPFSAPER